MSDAASSNPPVGVVVIGRNEGERLHRCLRSLVGVGRTIVYVDSGSTDGSQDFARSLGVEVVALDMGVPFTAARARNTGLERLLQLAPSTEFVQFVDGDCEVAPGWLEAGARALAQDETIAAVSGRLRERFPEKSIYNRLADLEWDRPVGDEKSCGGNAMMRVEALRRVGGFDPTLIAGEEPELCARMRASGYRIVRIADEMALHDLAMFEQKQWMTRARRHGYAILEVSYFRTPASRGLFRKQIVSALVWGVGWPIALIASLLSFAWTLLVLEGDVLTAASIGLLVTLVAMRFVQFLRLYRYGLNRRLGKEVAHKYAALLFNSKSANVHGMAQFLWRRLRGRRGQVIDYKASVTAPVQPAPQPGR